jgi:hypothetical protein
MAPFGSLSPDSGAPGTIVNASGGGFLPNQAITIMQSGPNATGGGGTITADANGEFDTNFRVADGTQPGRITIRFQQGNRSVTVHFTVD